VSLHGGNRVCELMAKEWFSPRCRSGEKLSNYAGMHVQYAGGTVVATS